MLGDAELTVATAAELLKKCPEFEALDELAKQTNCEIVGQAAVLAEGDAAEREDILFLEPLPLFFH